MDLKEAPVPLEPDRWLFAFNAALAAAHLQTPVSDPDLPALRLTDKNTGKTEEYAFDNTAINRAFISLREEFEHDEFISAGLRFLAFMKMLRSGTVGEPWVTGPSGGAQEVYESLIRAAAVCPLDREGAFPIGALLHEAERLHENPAAEPERPGLGSGDFLAH